MASFYTDDEQDPRLAAQPVQQAQQPTAQYVAPSENYSQGNTGYVAPGSMAAAPVASASNTARFRDAGITADEPPQQQPQQTQQTGQPSYQYTPGPANARLQAMTANPGQYGLPKSGFVHSLLDFIVPGGDPRSRNYEAQLGMAQRAAQMETQGMGAQARAQYEAEMAHSMAGYRMAAANWEGRRTGVANRPVYGKPYVDEKGYQHQPFSYVDPQSGQTVMDENVSESPTGVSADEAAKEAGRNARNASTNQTRKEIANTPARSRAPAAANPIKNALDIEKLARSEATTYDQNGKPQFDQVKYLRAKSRYQQQVQGGGMAPAHAATAPQGGAAQPQFQSQDDFASAFQRQQGRAPSQSEIARAKQAGYF